MYIICYKLFRWSRKIMGIVLYFMDKCFATVFLKYVNLWKKKISIDQLSHK